LPARPLFVYGTLRDPDVLGALLGRTLSPSQCVAATAPGFDAVYYPQRVYPALLASPDGNAPGLLLHDLTEVELAILDAFEGDEYRRDAIGILTACRATQADVYLPVISIAADAPRWTLEHWTRLHKASVLDGERRNAAALRDRLSERNEPST